MIIGITGFYASGKDAVADYLTTKGFKKFVYSDYLRAELKREGKSITRDNLISKGNEIRKKYGAGELSRRILEDIKKENLRDAVVVGLRNSEEVTEMRKAPRFTLWFVDAPADLRYRRSQHRMSLKDKVSYEEFLKQENQESSNDPHAQQLQKVAKMADMVIKNDKDLEHLYEQVEKILQLARN